MQFFTKDRYLCITKKIKCDIIEGEVRNITDFGIFVALTDSVDGLVKNADISWSGDHHDIKKGDKVKVMYLGHESYSRINFIKNFDIILLYLNLFYKTH